jgi:hypothetical protein
MNGFAAIHRFSTLNLLQTNRYFLTKLRDIVVNELFLRSQDGKALRNHIVSRAIMTALELFSHELLLLCSQSNCHSRIILKDYATSTMLVTLETAPLNWAFTLATMASAVRP